MKKFLVGCGIGLLFLSMTGAVNAAMIDVDLDSVASGTNISSSFNGVTFSMYQEISGSFGADTSVFAVELTTGNNVFGHTTPLNSLAAAEWKHESSAHKATLKISFDNPVDWFSIDFIANSDGDKGQLQSYNSAGAGLNTSPLSTAILSNGAVQTLQFSSTDISSALITGVGSTVMLDNLKYNSTNPVPIPSTIFLLGCGILGLAGANRKKRQK